MSPIKNLALPKPERRLPKFVTVEQAATLLATPLKELEREVRELKRANEILRKASAYFAQAELDRRGK